MKHHGIQKCSIAFILMFFFSASVFAQGQLKLTNFDLNKLPDAVIYEGTIKDSVGWMDAAGEHIIIATETGIHESNKFKHENEGLDAEIFAYHYIVKKDSATLIWKIHDFIQDCPVDIEASFIKNTLQVTDLDKDGIAEIWLMYKTACHGDVSPCDMKILLYQGLKKQVVSGQNKVHISKDLTDGGDYTFDKSFTNGPQAFRDFAIKLWEENLEENFNE